MKIITQNKKAYFDYEILNTIEAGIVLTGDEAKSARAPGGLSLIGSFADIRKGELFIRAMHIAAYSNAFAQPADTRRPRKLLLHKHELQRLVGDVSTKGITLIPLRAYINKTNRIKIEIGIAKRKKAPAKKQALKERDIRQETARALRNVVRFK